MAWKEQCKVAFKTTVRARSGPKGGIQDTMRELSKESGIPFNTLKRWYYEKNQEDKSIKNDTCEKIEQSLETKIKSIITRLKAATTIIESLNDGALELPEWKEVQNAHKALTMAILQGRKE